MSFDDDRNQHQKESHRDCRIDIIQQKHVIEIVLYMSDHGVVSENELRRNIIDSHKMISSRLDVLQAMDVVDYCPPDPRQKGRKIRRWHLTDRGIRLADNFRQTLDCLPMWPEPGCKKTTGSRHDD